ncbi:hypothetical protein A5695_06265 [Mycobacterium sp. E1747]|nr:hypothetical protein A5695_06265 [Mycobacterium sp. E1747]
MTGTASRWPRVIRPRHQRKVGIAGAGSSRVLAAAGATEVSRHKFGDNFRWVVLAGPEGNVFCVVGQSPPRRPDGGGSTALDCLA